MPQDSSVLDYCAEMIRHGNLTINQSRDLKRICIIFSELNYDQALLNYNLVTLESRLEKSVFSLSNLCMIEITNYAVYCKTKFRT